MGDRSSGKPSDAPIDVKWEVSGGGRLVGLGHLVEHREYFAGEVALEAADHLFGGLALGDPAGHVVLGRLMPAQADDHDPIQRGVGLPVATTVEAMATGLARGRLDGAG